MVDSSSIIALSTMVREVSYIKTDIMSRNFFLLRNRHKIRVWLADLTWA